ncbi:alpha/beta hydrolase [Algoriphagus marinus]|uniref:alpha/beta hydrolase n=1 Tax=Algoriphagus marinus TaxID=1925762 RepID=UPI0009FA59C9|nr:alpha/beta hydrolase [Algoriphagus marinus]
MKIVTIILFLLAIPSMLIAQEAWLSTPESINQFRAQVEGIKPAASQFDLLISDQTIPLPGREVDIRIYRPKSEGLKPTLIYVHGACWVAGSLDSHDEISRYLALKGDVTVIAIDYRLGPENKYPTAHDDVYEVSDWLWNHANELSLDTANFAISGESAGAYFAAAITLRARDTKESPKFSFQLLVYAAIDGGGSSWSACKDLYFDNQDQVRSDYGSPLWAKNLGDLPPTFNIRGEFEISRAEEELFMLKLKNEGILTESFMHEGVGHDVMTWGSVSQETSAHLKAVEYIKAGFGKK